jgi:hypothetical protein
MPMSAMTAKPFDSITITLLHEKSIKIKPQAEHFISVFCTA